MQCSTQKPSNREKLTLRLCSLAGVLSGFILFSGFKTPPKVFIPAPSSSTTLSSATLKNWGIVNDTGLTAKIKSHIDALMAWKIQKGNQNVVVAVIDTGVDTTHPDLKKNIWKDPSLSTATLSVYGWNYVNDKPNPTDDHGHGSHVAGIIGAVANPKAGVSGVAQNVSLMAVKYYSEKNSGAQNLKNTIKALNYAIDHGAQIINYSGGGPEFSEDEYLAIKRAESKGILIVAAAGNERQDTDKKENYYYPAAYRLTNIISVAATDINNQLLAASNWGKTRVDVAAPGERIYSTLPGGRYGYMSGTSQATAFVSGMAALLLSENPKLKPSEIRNIIIKSVDTVPHLRDKLLAGGKVNALSALLALRSPTTQPLIVGAPIIGVTPSSIQLTRPIASTGEQH